VTAIVASTSVDGINYNIGSLYGAGLFVTTLVVGMTILGAGESGVQLEPASIWRDVGFYIISTIIIIIFGAIGNLGIVAAIILLLLYALLVLCVFVQERYFSGIRWFSYLEKKEQENEHSLALVPAGNYHPLHDEHNIKPSDGTPSRSRSDSKGAQRFKHAVQ